MTENKRTKVDIDVGTKIPIPPKEAPKEYPIAKPKAVPIGNLGESAKKAVELTKA